MPDQALTQAALLALAVAACFVGLAWLALAMDTHWSQVRDAQPLSRTTGITLRILGSLALLASLWLCLRVDHASMAALVWLMALAASALAIAFTFAWRPRWLALLVAWVPGPGLR